MHFTVLNTRRQSLYLLSARLHEVMHVRLIRENNVRYVTAHCHATAFHSAGWSILLRHSDTPVGEV